MPTALRAVSRRRLIGFMLDPDQAVGKVGRHLLGVVACVRPDRFVVPAGEGLEIGALALYGEHQHFAVEGDLALVAQRVGDCG